MIDAICAHAGRKGTGASKAWLNGGPRRCRNHTAEVVEGGRKGAVGSGSVVECGREAVAKQSPGVAGGGGKMEAGEAEASPNWGEMPWRNIHQVLPKAGGEWEAGTAEAWLSGEAKRWRTKHQGLPGVAGKGEADAV